MARTKGAKKNTKTTNTKKTDEQKKKEETKKNQCKFSGYIDAEPQSTDSPESWLAKLERTRNWYARFMTVVDIHELYDVCDTANDSKVSWEVVQTMQSLKVVAQRIEEYAKQINAEINRLREPGGLISAQGHVFMDQTSRAIVPDNDTYRLHELFSDKKLMFNNVNLAEMIKTSNARIRKECTAYIKWNNPGTYDAYTDANLFEKFPYELQYDSFNKLFYLHYAFNSSETPQVTFRFSVSSTGSLFESYNIFPYANVMHVANDLIKLASKYELQVAMESKTNSS